MVTRFSAVLSTPVRRSIGCSLFLIALICLFSLAGSSAAIAQDESAFIREARTFEIENTGELYPSGLAYSPGATTFLVLEAAKAGQVSKIVRLTPLEERAGAVTIAVAIADPINIAFDSKANRLLLFDAVSHELIEIKANADGTLALETLTRYDVQHFGVQNAQGMTVDPSSGHLFILDQDGPRLIKVAPESDGSFDDATISTVDLQPTGLVNLRGLALEPTTGYLHTVHPAEETLYKLTQRGQVVASHDLTELHLGELRGMVFAPSGDLTDDPEQINLYVAHVDSSQGQTANAFEREQFTPGQNQIYLPQILGGSGNGGSNSIKQTPGQIVEIAFVAPMVVSAASTFQSSLVQTVDMSQWNPPSPDPSGLTYLRNNDTLVMVDGEVEETAGGVTHFAGANLWEFTRSGHVNRTANISNMASAVLQLTNEPNGVAWNPDKGHYYFSTDARDRVITVEAGLDGTIDASDRWYFFTTNAQNTDPEGITFGQRNGEDRLWIADGVNNEVYEYALDGTLKDQFDVAIYGVFDPETVEFNWEAGTLFVMRSSRMPRQDPYVIVETTLSGVLLQTVNISAAGATKPAGLAYAPASDGTPANRFYIVARGIDNDSDPNIIDGKMYELTAPVSTPPGNTVPVARDDSYGTGEETELAIPAPGLLDNDEDTDGDTLTAVLVSNPANGTLTLQTDGSFAYTPHTNFAGVDTFSYKANDGRADSDTATVAIHVVGVNDAPTDLTLSASTVDENAANATVGSLSTSDPDSDDTHSYSLVEGEGADDNASFMLVGNQLQTAVALDYESQSSHTIRVRTTDAGDLFHEAIFTISVNDRNESSTEITLSASSVDENALDAVVGTFSTNAPGGSGPYLYTLVEGEGADDNGNFLINDDELQVQGSFNFESKATYTIRVRSTNSEQLFVEQSFSIVVTDVNEPPSGLSLSGSTVAENSAAGTVVGSLNANDPDSGHSLTYSLVDVDNDANSTLFVVEGNELKTGVIFDYESGTTSYVVKLRVRDEQNLFEDQIFTITIDNVNDALYALTVSKSGTGNGSVTSTPAGIDCGSDCSASYASGTVVTLQAVADAGSTFTGWSGACSGTGDCVVTLDSAKEATAGFALSGSVLTVSPAGTGSGTVTSTPAGIDCGSDCSESYAPGTVVTLQAVAAASSNFAGWSGACSGTGQCTVTVDSAKQVGATFNLKRPKLTVTKSGIGTGTVTSVPTGINCGTACTQNYDYNTIVTLQAMPQAGSLFSGWSGACTGTGDCIVTMSKDHTVDAKFMLDTSGGSATIIIVEDSQPDHAVNFQFNGDSLGTFTLDDITPQDSDAYANSKSFTVAPGTYVFRESVPDGWALSSIACTPNSGSVDLADQQVSVSVQAGETVTCTFTNQRAGTVRVVKYHDLNNNSRRNSGEPYLADWSFTLYNSQGAAVGTQSSNSQGRASFTGVPAGSYTLCEQLTSGWFNTLPGTIHPTYGQPCYELTVAAGATATGTFGNSNSAAAASAPADGSAGVVYGLVPEAANNDADKPLASNDDAWLNSPEQSVENRLFIPLLNHHD